jgi:hypothetical protein
MVPYQECTVDMLTNTVTCTEHCFDGAETTCPVIGSLLWRDAVYDMVVHGIPWGTGLASALHVRQAFDIFDRPLVQSVLGEFGMSLAGNDVGWMSNTPNTNSFANELAARKAEIIDGSALTIETAPWIWQDLPPGADDMLERIDYFTR